MCNIWRNEIPQLAGKVKLMPLPAWTRGGRRTSVWGGTMLGILRTAPDVDACWQFAKHLYLSPDLARELYTRGAIITPLRTMWDARVFDKPDPLFSGQPKGRMYIDLAPQVPARNSSPFGFIASTRLQNAVVELARISRAAGGLPVDVLETHAQRLLADAQRE